MVNKFQLELLKATVVGFVVVDIVIVVVVVVNVIFMFNPNTVLRLCCVVLSLGL